MSAEEFSKWIVKRAGEYLSAVVVSRWGEVQFVRWRKSAYDAWMTDDKETAEDIAGKFMGEIVRFNPITGDIRE